MGETSQTLASGSASIGANAMLKLAIATIDQQIAVAKVMLRDLPVGGQQSDAIGAWLVEMLEARDSYRQLLRNSNGGQ